MASPVTPPVRILRKPQVLQKIGLSNSQLYNLINLGKFPAQIKLGERASGWLEQEVDQWIEKRVSESRGESHQAA